MAEREGGRARRARHTSLAAIPAVPPHPKTSANWPLGSIALYSYYCWRPFLRGPAKAYLKRYGVEYSSVYDGAGILAGKFGVTGTPETFFIDRRGRVIPPHIIAQTKRADLDAGIKRALNA